MNGTRRRDHQQTVTLIQNNRFDHSFLTPAK
jgi:hypothetical protein